MLAENVLAAGVRLGTPVALASLGETVSERAGTINVGLEGMMLVGALTGVLGAHYGGNAWWGLAAGIAGGVGLALVQGLTSITLKADQVVCGIALNLLALGATSFVLDGFYGGVSLDAPGLSAIAIPGLGRLPLVGPVLFDQNIGVYCLYVLLPVIVFVLYKTRWGLNVTAAGEEPFAADAMGVSVSRVRYSALLVAGSMAGLGGSILSLGELHFFVDNMTQGRGFVALAAVLLGNWRPTRAVLFAGFFGLMEAVQLQLQALGIGGPAEAWQMLPYAGALIILAGLLGKTRAPRHLGSSYRRA